MAVEPKPGIPDGCPLDPFMEDVPKELPNELCSGAVEDDCPIVVLCCPNDVPFNVEDPGKVLDEENPPCSCWPSNAPWSSFENKDGTFIPPIPPSSVLFAAKKAAATVPAMMTPDAAPNVAREGA